MHRVCPYSSAYTLCAAAFVRRYLVDAVKLEAEAWSADRWAPLAEQLADRERRSCRWSLQRAAAMIPFDAAEVTGGAWFDISRKHLLAGFSETCVGLFVACAIKMNPKWINILGILLFHQGAADGTSIKEGAPVDIKCRPAEVGSLVFWFRVLDGRGMEFIASFSSSGFKKTPVHTSFSDAKVGQGVITLQAFKKASDSGVYSCASLIRGTELKFGQVTRLAGEEERRAQVITTTTAAAMGQRPCTTATACDCTNEKPEATGLSLLCAPLILGPLAGGCGLLLLLLITTTMYCNKLRTRRCPHHYRRKPPIMAGGKQ